MEENEIEPVVPSKQHTSRIKMFLFYTIVTAVLIFFCVQIASQSEGRAFFEFSKFMYWLVLPTYFGFGRSLGESATSLGILVTILGSFGLSLFFRKVLPFLIFYIIGLVADFFLGFIFYAFRNG